MFRCSSAYLESSKDGLFTLSSLAAIWLLLFSPNLRQQVEIIGIAYDSGGVTTSTITVPLVTALGIGLSTCIKGRNPMIDGFGLIAFAEGLFPPIFVLIYGMVA